MADYETLSPIFGQPPAATLSAMLQRIAAGPAHGNDGPRSAEAAR